MFKNKISYFRYFKLVKHDELKIWLKILFFFISCKFIFTKSLDCVSRRLSVKRLSSFSQSPAATNCGGILAYTSIVGDSLETSPDGELGPAPVQSIRACMFQKTGEMNLLYHLCLLDVHYELQGFAHLSLRYQSVMVLVHCKILLQSWLSHHMF